MKDRKAPQTAWGRGAAFALLLACALLSASCEDPAKTVITNSTPLGMVYVAGGTFTMGSPEAEVNRYNDEVQHSVTVSNFFIGKYEVTQAQYRAVTGDSPSGFAGSGSLPVEKVTWYDAAEFCNKLSEAAGLDLAYTITDRTPSDGYPIIGATVTLDMSKNGYRLPTEAEWEYAARGGSNRSSPYRVYAGSDTIDDVAWYDGNSSKKTHEAGGKAANTLGLYDMSGNVYEWCWDRYGVYPSNTETNPEGASSGSYRVLRGGSWLNTAAIVRSAYRYYSSPSSPSRTYGFRLVRSAN